MRGKARGQHVNTSDHAHGRPLRPAGCRVALQRPARRAAIEELTDQIVKLDDADGSGHRALCAKCGFSRRSTPFADTLDAHPISARWFGERTERDQ